MASKRGGYLNRLKRRLAFLETRIAKRDKRVKIHAGKTYDPDSFNDPGTKYDKGEASALRWAIFMIEELVIPILDERDPHEQIDPNKPIDGEF